MKAEEISRSITALDDRHVVACAQYAPPRKIRLHRMTAIAAAACLALCLGLGVYATGGMTSIFERMQSLWGTQEVLDDAQTYMLTQSPEPETVYLPDFDNSRITLSERYYDGEQLLLGLQLQEAVPAPVVGYQIDDALREKIQYVAFFEDVYGDDDLDHRLAAGMQEDIYTDYLSNRSPHALAHDLRHISAITLDDYLYRILPEAEYERAWELLEETGELCVVTGSVYIGDHAVSDDGIDLGPLGQTALDDSELDAHAGDILLVADQLPDSLRQLDRLRFSLTVHNTRTYYRMTLDGPAYFYNELVGEEPVSFTVERAG